MPSLQHYEMYERSFSYSTEAIFVSNYYNLVRLRHLDTFNILQPQTLKSFLSVSKKSYVLVPGARASFLTGTVQFSCSIKTVIFIEHTQTFRFSCAHEAVHVLPVMIFTLFKSVPGAGIEPACLAAQHFKCCAYTNSATQA